MLVSSGGRGWTPPAGRVWLTVGLWERRRKKYFLTAKIAILLSKYQVWKNLVQLKKTFAILFVKDTASWSYYFHRHNCAKTVHSDYYRPKFKALISSKIKRKHYNETTVKQK